MLYILKGHEPVPTTDVLEWGKWYETADRHVAYNELPGGRCISTIFLGIAAVSLEVGWPGKYKPILFETLVFQGRNEIDGRRYETWEQAEAGHALMLEKWKQIWAAEKRAD